MAFHDVTRIALRIKGFVNGLDGEVKTRLHQSPFGQVVCNSHPAVLFLLKRDVGSSCAPPKVVKLLNLTHSFCSFLLQKFRNVNPHISSGLMPILFIFLPLFPFYFFLSGNREINLPFTR
jgi:hypothetical protein